MDDAVPKRSRVRIPSGPIEMLTKKWLCNNNLLKDELLQQCCSHLKAIKVIVIAFIKQKP